jgi:hypothetical protein
LVIEAIAVKGTEDLGVQQTKQQRIVVMLGPRRRPVIAFSNPDRAVEWLTNPDNMASVEIVF